MTKQELIRLMTTDVQGWNRYKLDHAHEDERIDLSGAELQNADLARVNLTSVSLVAADFSNAFVWGTDFGGADLTKAKFDGASLSHASLDGSILQGASFARATLQYTSLYRARMRGVDLTGATLFYTSFVGVDLSEAIGLDRVTHYGPSAIDIDTFYRSKGKIPESFLRGTGIPENFILVILSAASLASEWVKTEIRNALRQERISGKRKLFPIALCPFAEVREWACFDAESGKDLGIEMREYYIPDFSSWKDHDRFEAEFKKLIRDLEAESSLKP